MRTRNVSYSPATRRTYTGEMWRWVLPVAAVAAVLIGFLASRNGPTSHVNAHAAPTTTKAVTTPPPPAICGSRTGTATVKHVVWIWFGSQAYKHVIGKVRIAPYMNQLAGQCGLATRYSSITHPAIANDVGVLTGDPHGLVHNACSPCTTTAKSLLSQVRSWRAFVGGMPAPCRKLAGNDVLPPLQPAQLPDAARLPANRPAAGDACERRSAADARGEHAAGLHARRARRLSRHVLQQALRRAGQARRRSSPAATCGCTAGSTRSRRRPPTARDRP